MYCALYDVYRTLHCKHWCMPCSINTFWLRRGVNEGPRSNLDILSWRTLFYVELIKILILLNIYNTAMRLIEFRDSFRKVRSCLCRTLTCTCSSRTLTCMCSNKTLTCTCSSRTITCTCSSRSLTCTCSGRTLTCTCSSRSLTCTCSSRTLTCTSSSITCYGGQSF